MQRYNAQIPTKIFHITDIENLQLILSSGELKAKNILNQNNIEYCNIAYTDVQNKRNTTMVPIGKGGNLHDYVPFYFAPRSPMLDVIHHGRVGHKNGQENICHLVTNAQEIDRAKLNYVFTNGHAIMQPVEFFDSIDGINQVDWEIFFERPLLDGYAMYWHDKHDDRNPKWIDRKRLRQAEFLVHQTLKWEYIDKVGIINHAKAKQVQMIFDRFNIKTPIVVKPEWYY